MPTVGFQMRPFSVPVAHLPVCQSGKDLIRSEERLSSLMGELDLRRIIRKMKKPWKVVMTRLTAQMMNGPESAVAEVAAVREKSQEMRRTRTSMMTIVGEGNR